MTIYHFPHEDGSLRRLVWEMPSAQRLHEGVTLPQAREAHRESGAAFRRQAEAQYAADLAHAAYRASLDRMVACQDKPADNESRRESEAAYERDYILAEKLVAAFKAAEAAYEETSSRCLAMGVHPVREVP